VQFIAKYAACNQVSIIFTLTSMQKFMDVSVREGPVSELIEDSSTPSDCQN
jgi:hypothetical protein